MRKKPYWLWDVQMNVYREASVQYQTAGRVCWFTHLKFKLVTFLIDLIERYP